jgi:hypothetical protein
MNMWIYINRKSYPPCRFGRIELLGEKIIKNKAGLFVPAFYIVENREELHLVHVFHFLFVEVHFLGILFLLVQAHENIGNDLDIGFIVCFKRGYTIVGVYTLFTVFDGIIQVSGHQGFQFRFFLHILGFGTFDLVHIFTPVVSLVVVMTGYEQGCIGRLAGF